MSSLPVQPLDLGRYLGLILGVILGLGVIVAPEIMAQGPNPLDFGQITAQDPANFDLGQMAAQGPAHFNLGYELRAQEVVRSLTRTNGLMSWPFNQPQMWPMSELPRRLPGVSWVLDTSPTQLQSLVLTGLDLGQKADLSQLPFLRRLEVGGNNFQSLNLGGNPSLEIIMVNDNALEVLNIPDSPALLDLRAASNHLKTLDLSGYPQLQELAVGGNQLGEIHLDSVASLESLEISNNRLLFLNTLSNPKLHRLLASFNSLDSIDLSANPLLEELSIRDNQLIRLSLKSNPLLTDLDGGKNQLREMDLSQNPKLIHLTLDHNHLSTLDLSRQTQLKTLKIGDNPLSTIILGDNPLSSLETLSLEKCRLPLSRLVTLMPLATGRTRLGPQGPVFFETLTVPPGQGLDFSGEALIGDSPTKFMVVTGQGRRAPRGSWSLDQGIITFQRPGHYRIQMTNPQVISTGKKNRPEQLPRTVKVKVETGLIVVKL